MGCPYASLGTSCIFAMSISSSLFGRAGLLAILISHIANQKIILNIIQS